VLLAPTGRLKAEVKARASGEGFQTLEGWLGANDLHFFRQDGAAPLVVVPSPICLRLLAGEGAGWVFVPADNYSGTIWFPVLFSPVLTADRRS
jgi:hypothetical protein